MNSETLIAGVDLGSNSFRLEIGRYEQGQLKKVDYLKVPVRLGAGLDAERRLTQDAMQRGLDCLSRFHERLRGFDASSVRVVATQTVREAKNQEEFLRMGSQALGFPIEVISGTEEARLIYQGVAHLLPASPERRLVMDIGGRSTEIMLGSDLNASQTNSFRVGSASWSMKYFPDGYLTAKNLERGEIAAQAVMEEAIEHYPRKSWDAAYGSSGTVGAISDILAVAGWQPEVISLDGLRWLRRTMLAAGHIDNLKLTGLKDERRPVISGGLCLLLALMKQLQIEQLNVAHGALRHGILLDMLDRSDVSGDIRDLSVTRLAKTFSVDDSQVERVKETASYFFGQLNHPLPVKTAYEIHSPALRELIWACELHEIGTAISQSDHHKHAAYIIRNADIMGFTQSELQQLALIVLGQKGKLRKLGDALQSSAFIKVLLSMRLSVLLCHARQTPDYKQFKLRFLENKGTFKLSVAKAWMEAHPQSCHLLHVEMVAWQASGWRLLFAPEK